MEENEKAKKKMIKESDRIANRKRSEKERTKSKIEKIKRNTRETEENETQ